MRVSVLGLGLLGGSVAQGLTAGGHQVLGWDPDPATCAAAAAWGLPVADGLEAAVLPADVVVLAAPVDVNDDLLATVLARRPDVLVTDVGGVKVPFVQRWQAIGARGRVVPGHPMAGSERSGFAAADPALLLGARWVLCPGPWCTQEDWLVLAELVLGLGCYVVGAHPVRHDEAVARASHAVHVLSALVVDAVTADPLAASLAAGSFRDATRVGLAPAARTEAFTWANRGPLAEALHGLADGARAAAEELEDLDREAFGARLARAHARRQAWGAARRALGTVETVPLRDEGWAEQLHALADEGAVVTGVAGALLTVARDGGVG